MTTLEFGFFFLLLEVFIFRACDTVLGIFKNSFWIFINYLDIYRAIIKEIGWRCFQKHWEINFDSFLNVIKTCTLWYVILAKIIFSSRKSKITGILCAMVQALTCYWNKFYWELGTTGWCSIGRCGILSDENGRDYRNKGIPVSGNKNWIQKHTFLVQTETTPRFSGERWYRNLMLCRYFMLSLWSLCFLWVNRWLPKVVHKTNEFLHAKLKYVLWSGSCQWNSSSTHLRHVSKFYLVPLYIIVQKKII